MISRLFIAASLILTSVPAFATTWDEPWHDRVMKEAEHFVQAKVISSDEEKGVKITILKTLAGKEVEKEIEISDFFLLDICSSSGGHGPEFHFENVDTCYFFIKKAKGKWALPTPTSGFAYVRKGKVKATYRHSYHQALVPVDVYERTMTAAYKHSHGEKYDKEPIIAHIDKYLNMKPAGFDKEEIDIFFMQHVALEMIYHLRIPGKFDLINLFLRDDNFHSQISAARALITCNTTASKELLIMALEDTAKSDFLKVMAVWTLAEYKPVELKEKLKEIGKTASEEDNGFGGDIMDPRVCTNLPSTKDAIKKLVESLEK